MPDYSNNQRKRAILQNWAAYHQLNGSKINSKNRLHRHTLHKLERWIEIGLRNPLLDDEVFVKEIELLLRTTVVDSPYIQGPVDESSCCVFCLFRQTLKNVSHSSRHTLCPWCIVRLPSQHSPFDFSCLMFLSEFKWIWKKPDPLTVCKRERGVRLTASVPAKPKIQSAGKGFIHCMVFPYLLMNEEE